MCGITGFVGEGSRENLEAMTRTLIHRGPDDAGYFFEPGRVGFGFRRLAIIDLVAGRQPIVNEDGSVVVMLNGEIYNFQELRKDLEARHTFRSSGDTEVLAHLYEDAGEGMLEKLNGMFAFALWDARTQKLFLVRDRLGKKPLYWTQVGKTLIFGSELKAILAHPLVEKELDREALIQYLAYEYVPSPRTIFKGISKLEPAHALVFLRGQVRVWQYWDFPVASGEQPREIGEAEALERLEEELDRSCRMRLVSDVPLGVFLSGGIDSSTVTYFAQKNSPRPLRSFSIGFPEPAFHEAHFAKRVAERLGTEHVEYTFTENDFLESVPEIFRKLDEPLADASIVPTYVLSRLTRSEVTVALGGDGGDELFFGYPTFTAYRLAGLYRRLPGALRSGLIEPAVRALRPSFGDLALDFRAKKFIQGTAETPWVQNQIWLGAFSPAELKNLLPDYGGSIDAALVYAPTIRLHERVAFQPPLQALAYLYAKSYLVDQVLVKVDRASMMHGLEVRAPFLDFKLVEFVFRLPAMLKFRNFTTKYLLKRLMGPRLGPDIAYRKKKGFSVPVARWLRGPARALAVETLAPSRVREVGLFDAKWVERLLREHLEGREDHRKKLWTLMVFMWWHQHWYR